MVQSESHQNTPKRQTEIMHDKMVARPSIGFALPS